MGVKIAPIGGFVLGCMVIFPCGMYGYALVLPTIILLFSQYILKKEPLPLYRFFNLANACMTYFYFNFMDLMLELVLGLRIAYTIVEPTTTTTTTTTTAPSKQNESRRPLSSFISGPSQRSKTKVIIVNHRTRLDWLFVYALLSRTKAVPTIKVVLKESIMSIPVMGWAMQTFRFLFLSRKWEDDQERFRSFITYYRNTEDSTTLLIFPEGTDLSESNVEKSNAYAAKNGLPSFRYVLNPRTTGLVAIKNMIEAENIEEIIDITIAYTDYVPGERPSEPSLVNGRFPRKFHAVCSKHHFSPNATPTSDTIPMDDENFRLWVEKRFETKELLLSKFYSNNPVGFVKSDVEDAFGKGYTATVVDEEEGRSQEEAAAEPRRSVSFSSILDNWKYYTSRVHSPVWCIAILAFWVLPFVYAVTCCTWRLLVWFIVVYGLSHYITVKHQGFGNFLIAKCRYAKPSPSLSTSSSGGNGGDNNKSKKN